MPASIALHDARRRGSRAVATQAVPFPFSRFRAVEISQEAAGTTPIVWPGLVRARRTAPLVPSDYDDAAAFGGALLPEPGGRPGFFGASALFAGTTR